MLATCFEITDFSSKKILAKCFYTKKVVNYGENSYICCRICINHLIFNLITLILPYMTYIPKRTNPIVYAFVLLFSLAAMTNCGSKPQQEEKESNTVSRSPIETAAAQQEPDSTLAEATTADEKADTTTQEPGAPKPALKGAQTPLYMSVWGNVGGTGFLFDMDGTKGSYIPYDIAEAKTYGERRQLELVSYNPESGKCIVNAYLKGKYIGQFEGDFEEAVRETDDGGTYTYQTYDGIFTSVKGAKLDFHFHFD